jgi:hypothetical protein
MVTAIERWSGEDAERGDARMLRRPQFEAG